MLNQETIRTIASGSSTSQAVFKALNTRRRSRSAVNLNKLRYELLSQGQTVSYKDLVDTFKKLDHAKIGSFIKGKGSKPDRFEWDYSLKEVTNLGLGQGNVNPDVVKHATTTKRKAGRPKGSVNKSSVQKSNKTFSVTLDVNSTQLEKILSIMNH